MSTRNCSTGWWPETQTAGFAPQLHSAIFSSSAQCLHRTGASGSFGAAARAGGTDMGRKAAAARAALKGAYRPAAPPPQARVPQMLLPGWRRHSPRSQHPGSRRSTRGLRRRDIERRRRNFGGGRLRFRQHFEQIGGIFIGSGSSAAGSGVSTSESGGGATASGAGLAASGAGASGSGVGSSRNSGSSAALGAGAGPAGGAFRIFGRLCGKSVQIRRDIGFNGRTFDHGTGCIFDNWRLAVVVAGNSTTRASFSVGASAVTDCSSAAAGSTDILSS